MIGGGGGNTINNPNATGTSNLATTNSGADGGSIIFTSGNPVTVNGPGLTTFYNLSSTSNPSFTITTANTVLINGRVISALVVPGYIFLDLMHQYTDRHPYYLLISPVRDIIQVWNGLRQVVPLGLVLVTPMT